MSNLFNNPDNLVDMVRQVLSGKPIEEKKEELDPVNKKAVKKKFDDRKDKDIDNDGDVDSTDKYLHKRRKAISKEINEKDMECPSCGKMMTAAAGEKCPECGKMINAAHCEEVEEAKEIPEMKSKGYALAVKGKFVAVGSKADMMKLKKQKGGVVFMSPGAKIGDMAEEVELDEASSRSIDPDNPSVQDKKHSDLPFQNDGDGQIDVPGMDRWIKRLKKDWKKLSPNDKGISDRVFNLMIFIGDRNYEGSDSHLVFLLYVVKEKINIIDRYAEEELKDRFGLTSSQIKTAARMVKYWEIPLKYVLSKNKSKHPDPIELLDEVEGTIYESKDEDSDGEKMTAAQKKDMDGDGEKDKGEKKKKKKKDGEDDEPKADKVNTEPETDEVKTMMSEREMTDAEKAKLDKMKKKYEGGEMHKAMKAKYGDKADEVFYGKLTKMAMGESVEMNEQIVIKQKVEEAKDEEKDTNLIMQLRKAVSLRGNKVKFADGKSVVVSDKDAQKFMSMFSKLKKPAEKEMMMKSAAKSHKHFKMALSGRVEKPKSGGPDLPKLKSEK